MKCDLEKAKQRMLDKPIKPPAPRTRYREPKRIPKDNRRTALAEMEVLFNEKH